MIEVLATGPLTTVQDRGRTGYAALGVGRSGAADRPALDRANALVGNAAGAAGLEITLGGFRARFTEPATIALTGAPCPATLAGAPVAADRPLPVLAGAELRLRAPASGLRTYLAVRGGIDVPRVLGSRATDVAAALGPPIVARGVHLPVGTEIAAGPTSATAPLAAVRSMLEVVPGPRADWFERDALTALCSAPYTVTPHSDRTGLRLAGPVLERRVRRELPAEGMVEGALQVPPDGQPVLFLADHPVTGGYPVIGVVTAAGVALAAQTRPGRTLTFWIAQREDSDQR